LVDLDDIAWPYQYRRITAAPAPWRYDAAVRRTSQTAKAAMPYDLPRPEDKERLSHSSE
jgi:hypothetical protein